MSRHKKINWFLTYSRCLEPSRNGNGLGMCRNTTAIDEKKKKESPTASNKMGKDRGEEN